MNEAYKAGKFERFGISNYSARQVEELVSICEKNGWVKPSVYQVSSANPFTLTQYDTISNQVPMHRASITPFHEAMKTICFPF